MLTDSIVQSDIRFLLKRQCGYILRSFCAKAFLVSGSKNSTVNLEPPVYCSLQNADACLMMGPADADSCIMMEPAECWCKHYDGACRMLMPTLWWSLQNADASIMMEPAECWCLHHDGACRMLMPASWWSLQNADACVAVALLHNT